MDVTQLDGKSFALVLIDENEEGVTFYGTARWNGVTLTIDRGDKPAFEVREEWYGRIQPVNSPVIKAVLDNAEFWLKLRVGPMPSDQTGSEPTGLTWPK